MKLPTSLLLCLGVFCATSQVQAKRKHHPAPPSAEALATPAPEPPALPAEAAPHISLDSSPSASLQPFIDTHLSRILAPLGESAFSQPEVIASIKASYADGQASVADGRKSAFEAAEAVCDALANAMTERVAAVAALRGALASRSSEAQQPRGGGEAVAQARDRDTFFVERQKSNWTARAALLSQGITNLYLRERTLERQPGAWPPPPPSVATVQPVIAPVPTPTGLDPVLGQWMQEGNPAKFTLAADHNIAGERHGSWSYTCTTNAGRNYELYWGGGKWIDYVILSGDGKVMDGKNKKNQHVLVFRQ